MMPIEERKPPKGKFRVVGVDTFDGDDWVAGDFDTRESALNYVLAETSGKQMLMMHVYDDTGRHVGSGGNY